MIVKTVPFWNRFSKALLAIASRFFIFYDKYESGIMSGGNYMKWWQSEIVYQIYPKSFQDSNGDGIGDLRGIINRLDYLADLGITCIWICPIYKSPMADNGYDISDYMAIEESFGSLDDLKELIQEARAYNIKILLDLVVNHTSDEHKWFQEALRNPNSPYRDYYIFKEGSNPPNNWRSIFGGSVWEKVPGEEVYYYHTFHRKQPDLNWENPKLRLEIYNMVNQWLDMGIAGFRVDAITFIKKDLSFKSIEPDGIDGLAKCTKVSRNQPGIGVFLKELREHCFSKYDCMTVAEAPGVPYDQLGEYIGLEGYFSMIFDFKHVDLDVKSGSEWFVPVDWTWSQLFQIIEDSQLAIQSVGWGAPFIENHDQNRATSKYLKKYQKNPDAVKALALMYFFLRGTSFIYQGQELGLVNARRSSIEEFDDISSVDQYYRGIQEGLTEEQSLSVINYRSRDNSRLPMPWSNQSHQGFSTNRPWIEPGNLDQKMTVESQLADPQSVLNFYKQMIAFAKGDEKSVLNFGSIAFPERTEEGVFLYRRARKGKSILIVVNLTPERKQLTLEKTIRQVLFSNQVAAIVEGHNLDLNPFGALVLEEENE